MRLRVLIVQILRLNARAAYLRRFPTQFLFRATAEEGESLRSQIATLKIGRGQHRKYAPSLFTEHGALMLATVLNSPRAIEVSVMIVEAFVQMRHATRLHAELAERVDELEGRLGKHDSAIAAILAAIRRLGQLPVPAVARPIGFTANLDKK
jgi:ORF6N domain